MERRTFLRTTGLALAGSALVVPAAGDHGEENPTPVDGSEIYQPKVQTIRAPLRGRAERPTTTSATT
jgi:hypothetical protein